MRILLFTGKGGVGKTSVAAATALRCAEMGRRTLVMSADAAHSLSDALACPVGVEPTRVAPNLHALEIDVPRELERNWGKIRSFVVGNLRKLTDFSDVVAGEMAVWPGMDELFGLLRVKQFHDEGRYENVIMDCAPTGATVRMLSLPDVARWYMTRLFHIERRVMKMVRPLVNRVVTPDLPDDDVFQSLRNLYNRFDGVQEILTDPERSSVRLVMNPERMVIRESQRAYAYLSLFGFSVDAIVVNRVIPETARGEFAATWRKIQRGYLEEIDAAFAPLPFLRAAQRSGEILGLDELRALADELYPERDPAAVFHAGRPMEFVEEDGRQALHLALPFTDREAIEVWTRGEELVIRVNNVRRNVLLPRTLGGRCVRQATLQEGILRVTFGDDGHDP